MGVFDDVKTYARRQLAPVTIGLMGAFIVTALLIWFLKPQSVGAFTFGPNGFSHPWSLITYPFVYPWLYSGGGMVALIFTLYWLLWVGGSVEREIGSSKYGIFIAAATVLPALFIWIGLFVLRANEELMGPMLPLGALTVAWGFRNPTMRIFLMFVLPFTGFWLAILTIGVVFFDYSTPVILLGFFAILHLGVAYLFSQNRIPFFQYSKPVYAYKPSKPQGEKESRFMDDVRRRTQEREERERLRKLLESSIEEEDAG